MTDPYEVLGVPRNVSEAELKEAYRRLAQQYQSPDGNMSDDAIEKMKEINDAYDQIISQRRNPAGGGNDNYYAGYSPNNPASEFSDIRSLIMSGKYEQAQTLLDGIPIDRRSAEWYYLNGSVLYRRGWFDQAYTNFATAARMEPSNREYASALNEMENKRSGNPYRTHNAPTNMGGGCTACDICQGLICADCCCECLGGDLIRCC